MAGLNLSVKTQSNKAAKRLLESNRCACLFLTGNLGGNGLPVKQKLQTNRVYKVTSLKR